MAARELPRRISAKRRHCKSTARISTTVPFQHSSQLCSQSAYQFSHKHLLTACAPFESATRSDAIEHPIRQCTPSLWLCRHRLQQTNSRSIFVSSIRVRYNGYSTGIYAQSIRPTRPGTIRLLPTWISASAHRKPSLTLPKDRYADWFHSLI